MKEHEAPESQGLYDSRYEHDACGIGFVAHIKGKKSHRVIVDALEILRRLDHRGAIGADPLQGDGAGILIQIPDSLYREELSAQGIALPHAGRYGVATLFLPQIPAEEYACRDSFERVVKQEGLKLVAWRKVPIDDDLLTSPAVKRGEPVIYQAFLELPGESQDALERKLYISRKLISHAVQGLRLPRGKQFYIASMSSRTVVYKGLLLADQVGQYYRDLADERCTTALAIVHQRFSTNTFPSWDLAHPFRYVAHNGEINTVRGNCNWVHAREKGIASGLLKDDLPRIWPLIYPGQSDSASFDNALELMVMAGYPVEQAVMLMIPEAWESNEHMDPARRAFYEYHASMMEPWDGPAAMVFTDGVKIGATLDRNGLRPARYVQTDDDFIVLASEVGVASFPEERIVKKWRLQPGRMLLVDTEEGRVVSDEEVKNRLAAKQPYEKLVKKLTIKFDGLPDSPNAALPPTCLTRTEAQAVFGYTREDLKFLLQPMAVSGEEAIGSMGNDSPLAVLSDRPKPLFNYFKQMFAQVTNPPIDPIRESMVMSLVSFIGPSPNLLEINAEFGESRLEIPHPILTAQEINKIRDIDRLTKGKFNSVTLDLTFPARATDREVEAALYNLCKQAQSYAEKGVKILILSDRSASEERVPFPILLAVSSIHQHLVHLGLRTTTGLVAETGAARETHHFALLAAYGAGSVHPYLALESLAEFASDKESLAKYEKNYVKAVGKGLLKVMSKMGISAYLSYAGAQMFEAIGLGKDFVDRFFYGTTSQIDGAGFAEVIGEARALHRLAWQRRGLDEGGEYAWRAQGEEHAWSPDAISKLQHATRSGKYETFKDFSHLSNQQGKTLTLRGLLEIKATGSAIDIDLVEPATEIVRRFSTGAMSLGSISTEAHTSLAIAMNRIGGKSNTGEGGEDPARFPKVQESKLVSEMLGVGVLERDQNLIPGDSLRSAIKQIASGRFGVTAEYLVNADQLQIKMAQGAKPGEGGQLPGHKVSDYIGYLRHSVPGVGLISPPPHHDIYSIEDLAQLIYDLRSVNPKASVSVKLVAEAGVGTVAAGVAKAKADHIVIAGYDGGTGASPLSSVKHAGSPWELGLAETQQTLILNNLRSRVRLQVDGQLKTGRDVAIAAILGADEFGFATAPLVTQGCLMMRKCHLNTCPVGVATQDPRLRKMFQGQPEHLVNYFFFVAEEVREIMASLGVRKLDDLIGRTEYLVVRDDIEREKAKLLDFSRLLYVPTVRNTPRHHVNHDSQKLEALTDSRFLAQAQPALQAGAPVIIQQHVCNVDRAFGTGLSGEVARRFGHKGLPDGTIQLNVKGTAGQSLGAFLARGIRLDLEGEANDYAGKGLSGGILVVKPYRDFYGKANENVIVGNTVLYGATEGEAFFCGVAGERFAVRNSGASTVVEGVGDHGCEYMTGGTVVVLGETGRNFAAGMSGGIAYVLDEDGQFKNRCNLARVSLEEVEGDPAEEGTDAHVLTELLRKHRDYTDSIRAGEILEAFSVFRKRFRKVLPHEYRRVLEEKKERERLGVAV